MEDTIAATTRTAGPVVLTCERLVATEHGVIIECTPPAELADLYTTVTAALRVGMRARHHRGPGTGLPHLALAYGRANVETPVLNSDFGAGTREVVDGLLLVDHYQFASGGPGWDRATVRRASLGSAR